MAPAAPNATARPGAPAAKAVRSRRSGPALESMTADILSCLNATRVPGCSPPLTLRRSAGAPVFMSLTARPSDPDRPGPLRWTWRAHGRGQPTDPVAREWLAAQLGVAPAALNLGRE